MKCEICGAFSSGCDLCPGCQAACDEVVISDPEEGSKLSPNPEAFLVWYYEILS